MMASNRSVAAALACAIFLLASLSVGANRGEAAIYWGNGSPVGRASDDGTEADAEFIKYTPLTPSGISVAHNCGGVAVDGGHVYWADPASGTIGRANLDGSQANYSLIAGALNPCGIVVNSNHIYWANYTGNSIGRASLNGSSVSQAFIDAVSDSCGLAVDGKFIYWTSASLDYVGRALIETGDKGPPVIQENENVDYCGLALAGGKLFWGSFGSQIGRVNVDGSEVEPSFMTGVNGDMWHRCTWGSSVLV